MSLCRLLEICPGGPIAATVAASCLIRIPLNCIPSRLNHHHHHHHLHLLLLLRATHVIASTTEDLVARVKEIAGGAGAHAAVDSVAGEGAGWGQVVREGGDRGRGKGDRAEVS